MYTLDLVNINKSFNGNKVLNNLNLKLESGNIYCLLGEEKTGKSTLLMIISDLIKEDSGKIKYSDGISFFDLHILLDGNKSILLKKTVVENFYAIGFMNGFKKNEIDEKVVEYSKIFPRIINEEDILVEQLSYGEQRILGILALYLIDSKVVLIDGGLKYINPSDKENIMKFMKEKSKDKIVLLASEECDNCNNFFDKIFFLENGRIKK